MDLFKNTILVDFAGWAGAILILIAYILISTGKVKKDNKYYHLLNLVGSILFVYNTVYKEAYPSAFVNIVWFFIAVMGLLSNRNQKRA